MRYVLESPGTAKPVRKTWPIIICFYEPRCTVSMDKANSMNHQVISTEQNSRLILVKTHYGTYHRLCAIC